MLADAMNFFGPSSFGRKDSRMQQTKPTLRARAVIAGVMGCAAGLYCWLLLSHLRLGAADFQWAIAAARSIVKGQNPYGLSAEFYPVPAALFGLPFLAVRQEIAGAIFYGASTGLLAFGLTRSGYNRLLIFLAFPYWAGLVTAQWAPLLMSAAFFPLAMMAVLAKPQIGIPLFLTYPSKKGAMTCIALFALSVAIMPRWLRDWALKIRHFGDFYPILIFPGPLLLLALLRFRDKDARLLLITAFMPQRWFYDAFILWLVPKSRREILFTVAVSWGAGVWRWYHQPHSLHEIGLWTVLFLYLPMLAVVLARSFSGKKAAVTPAEVDA